MTGFLDDLKRQAQAVKDQHTADNTAHLRNAERVEDACKAMLGYFITLAEQVNVLHPASPARFQLDRKHVFEGLHLTDFYVDSRRKRLFKDEEVFDLLVLHWQAKSGQKLVVSKDFVRDMEQLELRLRQGGINVDVEPIRNHENGKLQEMRYSFLADFRGSVRVTPQHEAGLLQFQLQNLDALETITFELEGQALDTARLDELARWLVGQPHEFLRDVQKLRRVEA